MDLLALMKWPLIACLTLPWLLVYLGLHVVQREIIFVDLALAQVAALGTCVALLMGYNLHSGASYAWSAGFTVLGAILFTLTRSRHRRVPQEALIGIVYVVAAAAGILVLTQTTGGKEELQRSLIGELLVVPPSEVLQTIGLFLSVGIVHYLFRHKFLAISEDHAAAERSGLSVGWWDFLFYVLFGFVVTSFVHIGGVLLTFSYLIVPAVGANYLAASWRGRLAIGWIIAIVASLISLYLTPKLDLPIGATIVCVLGLLLPACALVGRWRPGPVTRSPDHPFEGPAAGQVSDADGRKRIVPSHR